MDPLAYFPSSTPQRPTSQNLKHAWVQALFDAARDGDEGAVTRLLKAGTSPNAVDSQGDTPLLCAAQEGHLGAVRLLLDAGASVAHANTSDETALHVAAWNGHTDCVKALLTAGADINRHGPEDETPPAAGCRRRPHRGALPLLAA